MIVSASKGQIALSIYLQGDPSGQQLLFLPDYVHNLAGTVYFDDFDLGMPWKFIQIFKLPKKNKADIGTTKSKTTEKNPQPGGSPCILSLLVWRSLLTLPGPWSWTLLLNLKIELILPFNFEVKSCWVSL